MSVTELRSSEDTRVARPGSSEDTRVARPGSSEDTRVARPRSGRPATAPGRLSDPATRFEPAPLPPRRPVGAPPVRIRPEDLQDPFPDFAMPVDERALAAARRAHPAGTSRSTGEPRRRDHPARTVARQGAGPATIAGSVTAGATATALLADPTPRRSPVAVPPPERRPNLRVVRAPSAGERRRQRTMLMIVLLATFCVAVAFFGAVVLHAKLAQGQVRLDSLRRAVKDQEKERTLLRSEVARLESPDRIVVAAKGLGLVVPNGIRFLHMTAATAP